MNLVSIAARNVLRNRFRTVLTILGGAIAVLAFVMIRTVLVAWNVGAEYAAKDRIATRNKVSIVVPLPMRYFDDIKNNVPGIKAITYMNWFGARWPKDPDMFFANMAVDDNIFDVYPEVILPPGAKEHWLEDRKGAIVGDMLAKRLGWKVGDKITLTGTIYPGDWDFNISAIYTAGEHTAMDRTGFYFHWKYLNEAAAPLYKNQVGWIASRIDDAKQGPAVSAAIDKLFDERDMQTETMSERAMNNGFISGFSAVFVALDAVSVIILLIMMLVLGNTIAMGVRERTTEYGVLRALGFLPHHIRLFIVGEAVTIALLSAIVGIALSYPIVEKGLGKWLEENMGSFFPSFLIDPVSVVIAVTLTLGLGVLASLIPAIRAGRLNVTDALRRIA